MPYSRGSSQPKDWIHVSHIADVKEKLKIYEEQNAQLRPKKAQDEISK